ncbi:RDD family protein [Occultella aeris]|uniref:RDD family protein n=1 Tax=Occultella aeris TaxID=2761496 RepID=A0A7M4DRB2_9MICO|nr:RDD family protein [Occultella aeris]VZO40006.1 RDD family protein [Occultella aeris]
MSGGPAGTKGRATPDGGASVANAPLGRRLVALAIDWALASVISYAFLDYHPLATLGVFALMTYLLVATLGFTIGHRLLGIGVRGIEGGASGPLRAAVRTVAICLVLPPVITGPDGRGLHDIWAKTRIVRL